MTNACEHGDHEAAEDKRFCSAACAVCENTSRGESGCDGMCLIRVGASYRVGKRLLHVRGVVDDHVVLRTWWRRKQRWEYQCTPLWIVAENLKDGYWVKVRRGGVT